MQAPRLMFHGLAGLLATLLLWAAPAGGERAIQSADVAYAASGSAVHQPPKQAEHASRRPRHTASLEEFFEIDDDAEQYWKSLPVLAREGAGRSIGPPPGQARPAYRDAPPAYRASAAYPTGPPHA